MPIDESPYQDLRRGLECPLSHPDPTALRDHSAQVISWLLDHWQTLADRPIGKSASRSVLESMLGKRLPEIGVGFEQVFAEFRDMVAPYACRVDHPRFLAFVPSAPHFLAVLGDILCAGTNYFTGVWLEAAGPAQVELIVLEWFKELLGYPASAAGILTSGGSEANLTALVVARERLGWKERPVSTLYLTEERHWSIDRAAKVIGLHQNQMRIVPTDSAGRMQLEALADMVRHDRAAALIPWAVVASAGTTNTGAVDPLDQLAHLCRLERLWLHVDAAYGWASVLIPEGQVMLQGIAQADSITLDPHKWFAQPFEAGCVLVRDGRRLSETFTHRPEYLQDVEPGEDEVNFADRGLALTRRFRALKIWLSVKAQGLCWFRSLVHRCCRLAVFAQAVLERSGAFEILSPAQLSIICFRYLPPDARQTGVAAWDAMKTTNCPTLPEQVLDRLNEQLLEEARASGQVFLSSTRWLGKFALRFCFVNWRTTAAEVEQVVELLHNLGDLLAQSNYGPKR